MRRGHLFVDSGARFLITPRGEEKLEQLREVWKQFSESVNELLFEEDLSQ